MHVRVEILGEEQIAANAGEETNDVHDQLADYRPGAEAPLRREPRTSAPDRRKGQGHSEIPTGILPSHMSRYQEGEDGEADGLKSDGGGRPGSPQTER